MYQCPPALPLEAETSVGFVAALDTRDLGAAWPYGVSLQATILADGCPSDTLGSGGTLCVPLCTSPLAASVYSAAVLAALQSMAAAGVQSTPMEEFEVWLSVCGMLTY
jgi:hypothetical protein